MLTEGGHVLLEHGGSFRSFINPAGNDALKMVELIVEKIPSYRDEATYEVQRGWIWKVVFLMFRKSDTMTGFKHVFKIFHIQQ